MAEFVRMHASSQSGHQEAGAEHDPLKADVAAVQAAGAAALHRMTANYNGFTPEQVQKMSLAEKVGHAVAFACPELAADVRDELIGALFIAIPIYVGLHLVGLGEAIDLVALGLTIWGHFQCGGDLIKFFQIIPRAKNEADLRAAGTDLANAAKDEGFSKLVHNVRTLIHAMSQVHNVDDANRLLGRVAGQAKGLAGTAYDALSHARDQLHGLGVEPAAHENHK